MKYNFGINNLFSIKVKILLLVFSLKESVNTIEIKSYFYILVYCRVTL
jgi:hypothetical protein